MAKNTEKQAPKTETPKTVAKATEEQKMATATATATLEDGTTVKYTLKNGKVIDAVIVKGKECCPTCGTKLPKQKALTEEQKKKAEERAEKLKQRMLEDVQHLHEMLQKNAEKLGTKAPTVEELLATLGQPAKTAEG